MWKTIALSAGFALIASSAAAQPQCDQRDSVLERLDVREKGGYERHEVELHFGDGVGSVQGALTYVATPRNRNYLGAASLLEVAAQVRGASGPSGPNVEYVLRLAEALREMGADDPHVFSLETLLREGDSALFGQAPSQTPREGRRPR